MAIKKVRIPREALPPLTSPLENGMLLQSAVNTTNAQDVPIFEYTTIGPHGLAVGDSVTISGIISSDTTPSNPGMFNLENAIVLDVPTSNTFWILAPGVYTNSYTSGGVVYKASGYYTIRFRIVSEDRNRSSHWSPQYLVAPSHIDQTSSITVSSSNGTLSVLWDLDQSQDYDVYVAWGSGITDPETNWGVGQYNYAATVSGSFFSMAIPDPGYTRAKVAVQTRTFPRRHLPAVVVAESLVVEI